MSAYILTSGDDRKFWVDPVEMPNEREALKYWTPELNRDTAARRDVLCVWEPVVLRMSTYKGKPDPRRLKDIHGFSAFAGLAMIVSQRCRDVLQHEFPGAAMYLPVEVLGAPQQYWALWVTEVVDALDLEQSQITEIAPTLKRVSIRQYQEDVIANYAMFRLPMVYGESDHVTDEFRTIVEKHGLTNFGFWDRTLRSARGHP